jgi:hypothetical protein
MQVINNVENAIQSLKNRGFSIDLNLDNNCLYCSVADMHFPLEHFQEVERFNIPPSSDHTMERVLIAVSSPQLNLKGFYIR